MSKIFMRQYCKILIVFLVAAVLLSVVSSCDSAENITETSSESLKTNTESVTVTETEKAHTEAEGEIAPVEKKDYHADHHMLIQPQSNKFSYYWVEESSNDILSQAIFTRQQKISDHLGVQLVATEALGHDQYGIPFMNSVKNKDGAIDTMLSQAYMFISGFIEGGYLADFNTLDGIDLEADYWSLDVMQDVAAGDHLYLGYSDFRLAHTLSIAYNKDMLERYGSALDESIYSIVKNHRWTLDKMISLANLVYIDKTSDGKTDDDTFGITGVQWIPFVNFLQASNIKLVDMNEKGDYEISVFTETTKERTAALVDKLSALSKSDYAWFRYRTDPTKIISVSDGQTLMSLEYIMNLPQLLSYGIDFGVLPYPMFDEAQKDVGYRSLDWGGWICIPSYVDDLNMVVDTLEMLSFFSADVKTAFYEKMLGKQVANAPEDSEMLNIIWDSICSDVGLTYSHISIGLDSNLYMLPNLTHANATDQLASYVNSYTTSCNKQLRKFFAGIEIKN